MLSAMASDAVTALVVAGGLATRFGSDKLAAPLHGVPLLDHLLLTLPEDWPVVVVGGERDLPRPVSWAREEPPGSGPLAGIAAGMSRVTTGLVAVVAGDMPHAAPALVELAHTLRTAPAEVAAAVAADHEDVPNPLLAVYRAAAVREALPEDPRDTPARSLLALRHVVVAVPGVAALDVDTPADLDELSSRGPTRETASPHGDGARSMTTVGTMKAITVPEPGGPDALVLADVDTPEPAAGEVLVRVVAAGVNRADTLQRQGHYPPPPGASDVIGLEVSGTVEALGDGVEGWSVGDEVCALLSGGGYAEFVAVPAAQLLPVPAGVPLADAAALPEVACTVWSNVFMTADLEPGEVLLVHGGSSGIGTMATQLARENGARVAVTAGSAAKLEACRGLGADILVDYHEEDFVEKVRDATDGHGADVVLDIIGAKYLARNLDVLATGGRLVIIGMQGGRAAELDIATLMGKRAAVIGTTLRARPAEEKAAIVAAVAEHVWPLVEDGSVRPVIHSRHPLADAAEAHREIEGSGHVGKILLTVE